LSAAVAFSSIVFGINLLCIASTWSEVISAGVATGSKGTSN
jgi:hypothetical protein